MLRSRPRLVGALALPLVLLTACSSVASPGAGLREDAAAADAALADARGLGLVLRFEDPDGALVRAVRGEGVPEALAELVVDSRIDVRVAATQGRRLAEQPAPDLPLAEQVRWWDSAVSVSTPGGDLLSYRSVDGDVYLTSDLDELERVAGLAGAPLSLRDELAGAPAAVQQAHDAVRDGAWLHLPTRELLEQLGDVAATQDDELPLGGGMPEHLLEDLHDAVRPHARLTDLGADGGVRRVTVEVDVKALLGAVAGTLQDGLPGDQGEELARELDELTDAPLTGTLTIEDGHYRRLAVPLAGLPDLAVRDPDVVVPDLGDSALVLEVDDTVQAVEVPTRTAEVDWLTGLASALGEVASRPALGSGPPGAAPLPPEPALLACYEQARLPEQVAACEATA